MYPSYRRFLELRSSGQREAANAMAEAVVKEFHNSPNEEFIISLCAEINRKSNHLLWAGIVLPFVEAGIANNPHAIKCLIQTISNLYSDKVAHARLGWVSEHQLIDQYLGMCPDDSWALARKQETLSQWLRYTIHEWPSGVLYGNDGASIDECSEILAAVDDLRRIDQERRFTDLCDRVESLTRMYRDRLTESANRDNSS
jgi:hypothetical protein